MNRRKGEFIGVYEVQAINEKRNPRVFINNARDYCVDYTIISGLLKLLLRNC